MLRVDANNTFKRLRNHYRLVVMNEDTYEEVVKFKLSRLSVYIVLSTTFVLLMIFNSFLNCFYANQILITWRWIRRCSTGKRIQAIKNENGFNGKCVA